jgi:hypothetical protein
MKTIRKEGIVSLVTILSSALLFTACMKDYDSEIISDVHGVTFDALTFEPLSGAIVIMEWAESNTSVPASDQNYQTTVESDGSYSFNNIPKGKYDIRFEKNAYKPMFSKEVDLSQGNAFVAFLPVTTSLTSSIGGITGTVTNMLGQPLANANIAISAEDESITNGYFSSTTTNEFGQFFIGAIPLQTNSEFKVRCIAEGYATDVRHNIKIKSNEMITFFYSLTPTLPVTKVFYEGFEGAMYNWEMKGYWNIIPDTTIYNQMTPRYVKLAPNDETSGKIPNAYKGNRVAWFGNPLTGNYLGEQSPFDYDLSGGTGIDKNNGTLISPIINLNGLTEASLNFWTWFEIESVNPNHTGYDLMEIYVIDSKGSPVALGKLNPYTDPLIPVRKALPFTSGGFNQAAVWKYQEFDLTEYTGTSIRIMFSFETRDGLFNGFRGWFLDEMVVIDKGLPKTKSSGYSSPPLMERNIE